MNPLRRFLAWRRDLLTPEHVEKASRRERWKRQAWMFSAVILGIIPATALATPLALTISLGKRPTAILIAVLWVALYGPIFRWGLHAFDLVAPWQFRDAEHKEECETR